MQFPYSWIIFALLIAGQVMFREKIKEKTWFLTLPSSSHLQNLQISDLASSTVTKNPTPSSQNEMKTIRFMNILGEACHFTEGYTWIMRACISSRCQTLSAISVCEQVVLCGYISSLRWLIYFWVAGPQNVQRGAARRHSQCFTLTQRC